MSIQRWEIYDTATGETDYWDLVRPLEQPATPEEAAANISDSVLAADGYDDHDASCWEAWGFEPESWDSKSKILIARSGGDGYWGDGHTLTATLAEHQQPGDTGDHQ